MNELERKRLCSFCKILFLLMAVINRLVLKICWARCQTNTSILLPLRRTLIWPGCTSGKPVHLNVNVTVCEPKFASNLKIVQFQIDKKQNIDYFEFTLLWCLLPVPFQRHFVQLKITLLQFLWRDQFVTRNLPFSYLNRSEISNRLRLRFD